MKKILFFLLGFTFLFSALHSEPVAGLKIERPLDKVVYLANFFGFGEKINERVNKIADLLNGVFKKNKIEQNVGRKDIFNFIGKLFQVEIDMDPAVNLIKDRSAIWGANLNLYLKQESPKEAFGLLTNVIKAYTTGSTLNIEYKPEEIIFRVPVKKGFKERTVYLKNLADGLLISTFEKGSIKSKFSERNLIEFYVSLRYLLKQMETEILKKLEEQKSLVDVKSLLDTIGELRAFYYHEGRSYIFTIRADMKESVNEMWKEILAEKGFRLADVPPLTPGTQIAFHTNVLFSKMYNILKDRLSKSNKEIYDEFVKREKLFSEKTGLDVQNDILSWLGTRVSFILKDLGDLKTRAMPSVVLMLQGTDDAGMKKFLGKLISFFANKPKIMFYEKRHGDVGISSTKLPFFPEGLEPSIAVIKDNFCIALNPEVLKEIIDSYKKGTAPAEGKDENEYFLYSYTDVGNLLPLMEKYLMNLISNQFEVCLRNKDVLKKAISDYETKSGNKIPFGRINRFQLMQSDILPQFSKGPFCVYDRLDTGEVDCRMHKNTLNVEYFRKKGHEIFQKFTVLKKMFMAKTRSISDGTMFFDFEVKLER